MTEYSCDKCNYHCKFKSELKKHMSSKKHNNQPRKQRFDKVLVEQCSFCPFTNNNLTNVTVHRLTKHSSPEQRAKEFKYYCINCDFGTFTKVSFSRHLVSNKHLQKQSQKQQEVLLS
jgi:hypothetical protein